MAEAIATPATPTGPGAGITGTSYAIRPEARCRLEHGVQYKLFWGHGTFSPWLLVGTAAASLQDFFGMRETPAVARGSVRVVVRLLAPNRRPVQMTSDLGGFWERLYPEVRRELSRRYPKHAWPENPMG